MGTRSEERRERLMATFHQEAAEHLRTITDQLVALERGLPAHEAAQTVELVFRATHTLKGASRSVGIESVERVCQRLESLLSALKNGRLAPSRELVGRMQQVVTGVGALASDQPSTVAPEDLLRLLDPGLAPATEPAPAVAPVTAAPSPSTAPATIRIGVARLDDLQARAENLLAAKLSAEERVREVQDLVEALGHVRMPAGTRDAAGATDRAWARAAEAQARRLLTHVARDRRALAAAVDGLQEEMRPLRMLPVASVLELLPGMVSQMARAAGKEVDFRSDGAELQMDRKVLEAVKDPLLHLVRNALDHGIEPPDARERADKARGGSIAVAFAALEGRWIDVRVQDDGAGIDVAGLRAGAVRCRLMSAEQAEALPEADALDLAFASGVSTSHVITDLSGHGLGMAIVRDRVERLGGRLSLTTTSGQGTCVRMLLPASIATFRGLLVRAGRQPLLLPIEAVARALRVAPEDVGNVGGRAAVRFEGRVVPAGDLAAVLGRRHDEDGNDGPRTCLIVADGESRAAFFVDEILGEREVLVKELAPPLVRVRHVAGAGLLGSGELALILRPGDLVRAVREASPAGESAPAAPGGAGARVLVVDDSITTRTMERNLLEAAGYTVEVASDGLEAWTALKSEGFDLVVTDVDMPRLDGFELTARIRADPQLKPLPVVLVTALESRQDKERGIDAGANAYVIKSGFDQSRLLDIIRRLL